jgi:hypothetical protein
LEIRPQVDFRLEKRLSARVRRVRRASGMWRILVPCPVGRIKAQRRKFQHGYHLLARHVEPRNNFLDRSAGFDVLENGRYGIGLSLKTHSPLRQPGTRSTAGHCDQSRVTTTFAPSYRENRNKAQTRAPPADLTPPYSCSFVFIRGHKTGFSRPFDQNPTHVHTPIKKISSARNLHIQQAKPHPLCPPATPTNPNFPPNACYS